MRPVASLLAALIGFSTPMTAQSQEPAIASEDRPRLRDLGRSPGLLAPGPNNAITDVAGVLVGQVSLIQGDTVRTGVTAIRPHPGNLFQAKVPAAAVVANGFGKLAGYTQIRELGEIETPIILTNTLSVAQGVEGVIDWSLAQAGNEDVRSVNAVVGETNDGGLNDIRGRHVRAADVVQAIETAQSGPVEEGSVGAGVGTIAFGFKGGIGTSSRQLPANLGGYVVGVLVQSNFGGALTIDGVPIGEPLGRYYLSGELQKDRADGSIMIVIATNAPLSDRNLRRLADRAFAGLARTGAAFSNGSGDYAIAFSTAQSVRRTPEVRSGVSTPQDLGNDRMSPLFVAVAEATEEAIINSILKATTTSSSANGESVTIDAIDIDSVRRLLQAAH